jgi:uncharacterized protein YbbC (DUF1343 family)
VTNADAAVLTGIDVLARDGFSALRGRKVGLVTNASGLDQAGRRTIDLLREAPGVELRALFSPEHGLGANADAKVRDGTDAATGLPVWSLYGARHRPPHHALRDLDTLVFDLQDAGARFFTYISTLGYVLEAAAAHRLALVVLDRPNPINGMAVEGPLLDRGRESFVGYHRLPVRHGMTIGELARLFNEERNVGADLSVIRMQGWRRADTMDRTGLRWVSPSPNLRSLEAALLYPGVALIELTNVSVGRGTCCPFQRVGAPWVRGDALAAALSNRGVPGVRFEATTFTPASGPHAGALCSGVAIRVTDAARLEAVKVGLALAGDLQRLSNGEFEASKIGMLLGNERTLTALLQGEPIERVAAGWAEELQAFQETRRRYLLY